MILKLFSLRAITRDDAKQARMKYLKAKSDVEIAARILRVYSAGPQLSPGNRKVLLHAAKEIQNSPMFAIDERLRSVSAIVDFGLFGQQGDKRAFAIHLLHISLPPDINNRYAMIRDLLRLIDIHATAPFIRSTIVKGHT
jgi:hypothetical protein